MLATLLAYAERIHNEQAVRPVEAPALSQVEACAEPCRSGAAPVAQSQPLAALQGEPSR
ncbi:MAG: hypothetical protein HW376_348 [candidate division NC10 bacterium]|nr:hypothetical protein [candidate division NC10 bacterium]